MKKEKKENWMSESTMEIVKNRKQRNSYYKRKGAILQQNIEDGNRKGKTRSLSKILCTQKEVPTANWCAKRCQ